MTLDEIRIANTPASLRADAGLRRDEDRRASPSTSSPTRRNKLGTQMKATGEVMSIGRTMEESLLKAVRSLEIGRLPHAITRNSTTWPNDDLLDYIKGGTDDRLYRHRRADPPRRRPGADLRRDADRHALPGEVQEHRRVRKASSRAHPMDVETAPRCQAHGFQRQVHRPAVGHVARTKCSVCARRAASSRSTR